MLIQSQTRAQTLEEVTRLLQQYVAINTSNPPGDTTKAADFLTAILEKEGVPVTRYESAPGKVIVYARLKATVSPPAGRAILLLHHMDVVPADRAQWKTDPFTPVIKGDELWGRGSMDMKGQGVAQLVAFLMLKRQNVPRTRDVILMAEPDEEVGGALGARWMIANHYAELDPEYVIDEGGFGSTDLFAPNKMVYGVSVAEKKIVWLKLRAEGVAGHGSQPTDTNPNDRLVRALARLLGNDVGRAFQGREGGPERPALQPSREPTVLDMMQAKVGAFAQNNFTNAIQHSTISLTWFRSGVGDPPKINVIPSVAEAGLDCRVLPGTTKDQWIAEIARRLDDPAIKIELINESDDPVVTSQDTPLYRNIEKAIQRRHPEAIVTPVLIPYGTDSNAFRPTGVKSYGIFPALLPADVVGSMHGDGEHISLASVREGAQLFFEALRDTLSPSTAPRAAAPIRVMLLDGESGGPYHDWKRTTQVLKKQLDETGLFQVDVVTAPPAGSSFSAFKPAFTTYQAVVLNYDAPDERWPAAPRTSFEQYVNGGGGVVSVHASDNAFPGWKA
ncbi:MAG TPA: M20/M25/M40 family metallo-hydrolase, partial [Vicinamibacterales bacterium]|nr:M20/M25/M40 family metallo-hydrolase [Vicinamibacterales bacterium]